jgi:two-component system sensor histidine kinase/response regulator
MHETTLSHFSLDSLAGDNRSMGRILIVDDVPANVRLLSGILKVQGFDVVGANSGPEALEILFSSAVNPETTTSIDVVLLDVMMPVMNGFEVCRSIRANEATAHLPVVIVTALNSTADRVHSLDAGADDFLTKPVEEVEVIARVRSLVRAKRDREALEKSYKDLKASEELRHFLAEMLVHDLRTPLTTVLVSLDLLHNEMDKQLDETHTEVIRLCNRSAKHLLSLVNELLDISKLESSEMELCRTKTDINSLVEDAIAHIAGQIKHYKTQVIVDADSDLPQIYVDEDLMRRVIVNLLGNALKFARHREPVMVNIEIDSANTNNIVITVKDDGDGIDPKDQKRIFSKFGQAELGKARKRTSTGLGLTFCKLVVEAHGGQIWVDSRPQNGSKFGISLPILAAD